MLSLTTGLCSFCYFWNEMGLLKAFVTFAILVLHEAGHLVAARMVGLPVSAPVFLGPVGAVIGLLKAPRDAAEAAWIGIGGPLAGIAATLVVHGIAWVSDSKLLFSCAVWGYLIHLFNMVPAGTLDGGHVAGFTARWLLVPGALVIAAIPFLLGPLPLAATITVVLLSLSALWRAAKLLLEYGGFVTPAGLVDKPREKWILSILGILVVLVAAVGAWLAMRDCARL
jgi:Zn-dependent protease